MVVIQLLLVLVPHGIADRTIDKCESAERTLVSNDARLVHLLSSFINLSNENALPATWRARLLVLSARVSYIALNAVWQVAVIM